MNKYMIQLFVVMLFCFGCSDDDSLSMVHEGGVDLVVLDEDGNDLLDDTQTFPKSIRLGLTELFFEIDGEEVLFVRPLEAPKGFWLVEPEGRKYYRLHMMLNTESKERITKTIIRWGDGTENVFETEFRRVSNGSILLRKIWMDGKLVIESGNKEIGFYDPGATIIITK